MKHFISAMTAYAWLHHNNDAFRGYFIVNDVLYKGADALSYLKTKYNSRICRNLLLHKETQIII